VAGLVPAIHVLIDARKKDVDARDKRGHDESEIVAVGIRPPRQGQHRRKHRRRIEHCERLAPAQIPRRLIDSIGILDLGARDGEVRIDLAAFSRRLGWQVVQMRLAQTGVAALFARAGNGRVRRFGQFIGPRQDQRAARSV
jgi:hypothetical protein